MSTKVKLVKNVKISSKGQITIPKLFLEKLNLSSGSDVSIIMDNNQIKIINRAQTQKAKLLNFKPISLGLNKKVNFSETHNDIYDQ